MTNKPSFTSTCYRLQEVYDGNHAFSCSQSQFVEKVVQNFLSIESILNQDNKKKRILDIMLEYFVTHGHQLTLNQEKDRNGLLNMKLSNN